MINIIWSIMVITSIVYATFIGKTDVIGNSLFSGLEDATSFVIKLTGVMCFWTGIINILRNTRLMTSVQLLLKPVVNTLFKNQSQKAKELITINMVSNALGIGNAATPSGIAALQEMDTNNNEKEMSTEMNLFILINTLSIQILPSTIISIRALHGSESPGRIIIPVWIVSILTFIPTIIIGRILFRKRRKQFE